MSAETQSRPAASRGGRGATRGGRGGFAGRNSTRRSNGDAKNDASLDSPEDEGEIGQLKKLYGDKTPIIQEMFPDWSEVDILFALRETSGDIERAVTSIAEGHIAQWDEVAPKPKKSKAKEPAAAAEPASTRPTRSGAGPEKTRARASARPAERGGRSARGRSAQPTNGARSDKPLSVPTQEYHAWDAVTAPEAPTAPAAPAATEQTTIDTPAPASAAPAAKTWASMLRQSTAPPKPVAKPKEAVAQKPADADFATTSDLDPTPTDASHEAPTDTPAPAQPEPAVAEETAEAPAPAPAAPDVVLPAVPAVVVPEIALAPSKDELTQSNLEQVADNSHPPTTDTNHSEANDSWDPQAGALPGTGTPISASQQQHQNASKAVGSGYVATAIKATDRAAVRTPSYSRRILDQEEAVRMPGNRDVDLSLKFGALNFTGAADEDIEDKREEAETRAQPPAESPVAHPRASLPPAHIAPDSFAGAPKQPTAAPGLPTPGAGVAPGVPGVPGVPGAGHPGQPAAQAYGRFGQDAAFGQKPYDPYASQPQVGGQPFENNYPGIPATSQAPAQPAPYSAGSGEYSQYFNSDQSRAPYNYYNYGQQAQGHQDGAQQRSYGYPLNESLNQYPQSNNSRFGGAAAASTTSGADAQASGSSTPNPPAAGQQAQPQAAGAGQHAQQHQAGQYQSYNHPYFASPYYNQYGGQYAGGFNQGSYNAPYGKANYGAHQPYGVNPQQQYDSQASGFGGASSLRHGGDNASVVAAAGGLNDFNRVGASQAGAQPSSYADNSFGRSGAGYQSQGQYGAQQSQVGAQQTGADGLKAFGEAKGAAGVVPSLARPGSATQSETQSGLPPPQSTAQQGGAVGYGGYQSHLQQGGLHGSQAAGGGYVGNQHGSYNAHGYGQQFGSQYYNNQQRGGWGNNYNH